MAEAVVMTGAYLSRERVGMGGKPVARVFVETPQAPVTTAAAQRPPELVRA